MTPTWKHLTFGLVVFVAAALSAVIADAQWYQTYYAPSAYQTYYAPAYQTYYAAPAYQTYYAPSAYQTSYAPSAYQTYYAPTAYQTYYGASPVAYRSGWYPGYWLDRTRAWLGGGRTTYVASYPSTYSVGYPATYGVGYSASYAPVASGCSTCSSHAVGYSPCSSCSRCEVATVSATGYIASPGCSTCSATQPMTVNEPTPADGSRGTFGPETGQPAIPRSQDVPPVRTEQKPAATEGNGGAGVSPVSDPSKDELDKVLDDVKKKQETYFQKPKLFQANDKEVLLWHPAPVRTAVYHRPQGESRDRVPTQLITWEKAKRDAVGWTSASK